MCVAAVIFEPVPLQDLECMEQDNPHGGGVAWEDKLSGNIRFVRGLTAREIYDLQTEGVMSYPYLLHFRWATHGGVTAELTHPFPVGPRALLGELSGNSDKVLIHNGTWNNYSRYAEKHVNAGNYDLPEEIIDAGSDTAVAAWLAMWNESLLDGVAWATAVAEMRETTDVDGNAVRTMDITTRGTWSDHQQNWYSNLNWLPSNKWYNYSSPSYSSAYTYRDSTGFPSEENDFYVGIPDGGGERSFENFHWDTCIRPFGWRSITASECYDKPEVGYDAKSRREKRAKDAYYVGKYNDICVRPEFYQVWTTEKDWYQPDNVSSADWYSRFFESEFNVYGQSQKQTEETSEENTESDASKEHGEQQQRRFLNAEEDSSTVAMGSDGARRSEFKDFESYLNAKYGPEAAGEILGCFPSQETIDGDSESNPYEALDAAWTKRKITDPDWLHGDGDDGLVSEDGATVNAWLAKQMVK